MDSTNQPLKGYSLYTCNELREDGSYSIFFVTTNKEIDYKLQLVQQAMFLILNHTRYNRISLKSNATLYTALTKVQSGVYNEHTIDCIFNALRKNQIPYLELSTYGLLR